MEVTFFTKHLSAVGRRTLHSYADVLYSHILVWICARCILHGQSEHMLGCLSMNSTAAFQLVCVCFIIHCCKSHNNAAVDPLCINIAAGGCIDPFPDTQWFGMESGLYIDRHGVEIACSGSLDARAPLPWGGQRSRQSRAISSNDGTFTATPALTPTTHAYVTTGKTWVIP